MKYFLIALQFLTIIPVQIKSRITSTDYTKSLLYFPVVGILIGAVTVSIMHIFMPLSHMVAAAVALIVSVVITGALHLDGFADTCDGFYGNRTKEEILRIMKDSHVGAVGAAGIVLLLLFKFTLLISINPHVVWKIIIISTVFSRWSQTLGCYLSVYAREDGKGKLFIGHARVKDVLIGGLITLIFSGLLLQIKGVFICLGGLLCAFLYLQYAKTKIDGMTGDMVGAMSEITETSILLLGLLLWN
ncbi:MAG: adenosylcobinamide-GDP ribazoletransferase [Candidatus Omnitrophica bacterium]|nr:adenosylcobinamide-GDP ribazoletransferase [Candidatus Omnitrophota bacterium]